MGNTVEILGFAREAAWLPWAVQYFFLIGISAAAFFLSLPGFVLGRASWSGVSRQALVAALVCGMTAPFALLADLHQPGRFLNFYLHPNLQSWMAWGAFFIPLYLFGLLLYAWLCLRPQRNRAAMALAAVVTALGAVLILLYTGMEVMLVEARPLWNTPLVPVLLAVTAFSGALGLTTLFEALARRRTNAPLLNRWTVVSHWLFLAVLCAWLVGGLTGASAAAADVLEAVRGSAGWAATLGWLLGGTLLALWVAHRHPHSQVLVALLALQGAWALRWVLFMGGQGIPKMGAAFRTYWLTPTPDGLFGIVGTAGLFLAIYIALVGFVRWDEPAQA